MNKLSKLAFIAATAVMAASASAQSVPASRQAVNDNWVNGTGEWVWMNGTNEPAGAMRSGRRPPPTRSAMAHWSPRHRSRRSLRSLRLSRARRSRIKLTHCSTSTRQRSPLGKQKLDELASKIEGMNTEVVVATGYTDRIGSDKYNDRLSLRRAQAVKSYLVSKGVPANKIYTEGKGKRNPVTTGCNQKNRSNSSPASHRIAAWKSKWLVRSKCRRRPFRQTKPRFSTASKPRSGGAFL